MKIEKYNILFCALLVSGLIVFLSKPCAADERNLEELFQDFKKIVVYIREFPREPAVAQPGFPAELQREAFHERVKNAVKENFAACIQSDGGGETPILVVTSGIKDFYDPDNLGFYIQVYFSPEQTVIRDIKTQAVTLDTHVFRAGLSPHASWASLNLAKHSRFYPSEEKPGVFASQLDSALHAALTPRMHGMGGRTYNACLKRAGK